VRGAAYLLTGRIAEAIPELQAAVQVLPLPANYSNLAYAHLLNGNLDQGEQDLHEALRVSDAPPQAHYLMGLVLLDRKPQNTEACDELYRAQSLMRAVHAALAVCYRRGGQEDSAIRQIHDLLSGSDQSSFNFWKHWVDSVAAETHPSSAFGLRTQPQPERQTN
jgi:tetratricopeptide (TPR) repeat protein